MASQAEVLEMVAKMRELEQLVKDLTAQKDDRGDRGPRRLDTKGMKTKVFTGLREEWEDFGFCFKVGIGQ